MDQISRERYRSPSTLSHSKRIYYGRRRYKLYIEEIYMEYYPFKGCLNNRLSDLPSSGHVFVQIHYSLSELGRVSVQKKAKTENETEQKKAQTSAQFELKAIISGEI